MEQPRTPIEQPETPRRRVTPLTRDERLMIHTLWRAGHKQQWIADHLGFKLRQVTYVLSGPVTPRKKTGRPKRRPASDEDVQELREGLQDLNNRLLQLQNGLQGANGGLQNINSGPQQTFIRRRQPGDNFGPQHIPVGNGPQRVEHRPHLFQEVPQQVYHHHRLPGQIDQVPQGLPQLFNQTAQPDHQVPQQIPQTQQHIHQASQHIHQVSESSQHMVTERQQTPREDGLQHTPIIQEPQQIPGDLDESPSTPRERQLQDTSGVQGPQNAAHETQSPSIDQEQQSTAQEPQHNQESQDTYDDLQETDSETSEE